jgi:hypothetical protein
MDVSKLSRRSIGRLSLEKAALKEICGCQFFDLQNSLSETSSRELLHIITHNYDCSLCGRKGVN